MSRLTGDRCRHPDRREPGKIDGADLRCCADQPYSSGGFLIWGLPPVRGSECKTSRSNNREQIPNGQGHRQARHARINDSDALKRPIGPESAIEHGEAVSRCITGKAAQARGAGRPVSPAGRSGRVKKPRRRVCRNGAEEKEARVIRRHRAENSDINLNTPGLPSGSLVATLEVQSQVRSAVEGPETVLNHCK